MVCFLKKAHRRGEHCSPVTPLTPTALRATSSKRGGFAKLSPLLEEMPDRAGGYIILGLTPETCSAESLVSLAVRLGLANAFVCLFLYVLC